MHANHDHTLTEILRILRQLTRNMATRGYFKPRKHHFQRGIVNRRHSDAQCHDLSHPKNLCNQRSTACEASTPGLTSVLIQLQGMLPLPNQHEEISTPDNKGRFILDSAENSPSSHPLDPRCANSPQRCRPSLRRDPKQPANTEARSRPRTRLHPHHHLQPNRENFPHHPARSI